MVKPQSTTSRQLKLCKKIHNFMRWKTIAFTLSSILLILSVTSLALRGLNWGLDFTGGSIMEVMFEKPTNLDTIRISLQQAGFSEVQVKNFGVSRDIIIRIAISNPLESHNLSNQIIHIITQSTRQHANLKHFEFIGPSVGEELIQSGILALIVALILIFIYVSFRFEWRLALGTVVALLHDVIMTLGMLSLLKIEINLTIIASLMSVIGYSLNDSIVISDRIRENFRSRYNNLMNAQEIVNLSLTQVVNRTIITSLTTLAVVTTLLLFGGEMLKGFSITMLMGIMFGTISSIYVVSALALELGMKGEHLNKIDIENRG
ncbi:MAG: protein translocase subunit SecF [Candidatus Dasytiphilus stammeri]